MILSRRVTIIIATLAAAMLLWNLVTPGNPDHILNVVEACVILAGMLACLWAIPPRFVQAVHSITLALAAVIAASTDGGLFFSGAMTVLLFVLIHAYGAFREHALWKLPAAVASIFLLCSVSSAHFTVPGPESLGLAAMWTLFVVGFLFVLWLALQEFRRQFLDEFALDLVAQNRKLLDENKSLLERCQDGDTAGKD